MTIQLEISPEDQAILKEERYRHPVLLVQRRMEALWLKSHNLPHALIAELVGVSDNTLRDYFRLYQVGGIKSLKEVNYYRPQSELVEHLPLLEAHFQAHPPASIKEAQAAIYELTGIQRSETQVREFLKKTQFALSQGRDDSCQS